MRLQLRLIRSVSLVWLFWAAVCSLALAQSRRGTFVEPPRSVRSRDVDQRHIRLDLKFDLEKQEAIGRAVLTLVPFKPIKTVILDAAGMQIQHVATQVPSPQVGSRDLKHSHQSQTLTVELEREYVPSDSLIITIDYRITRPEHGIHFVTPDESEPQQPRMLWTQSEPEYARYWFPCIDSPSDLLTSEIVAAVPKDFLTLSNGELKSKSANSDGTQTWHWEQKQPHTPYLLSLVAGEFEELKQDWNGIPVYSYVPRGRLSDAARSFRQTPEMMSFFSQRIGVKYPWPKYAQICVDEYMWGGMEHTSATTLTDRTLHDERAELDVSSEGLVSHELAHQWFGDLLTCKDWGELWLNESFATYFATLWQEQDEGWDEAAWTRQLEARAYLEEDKQYRRPIVTYQYQNPNNMFDSHSYPKGGRVLHMLRFVLGDELFWKSIHHYVSSNQHRTVETADLRRAIEDVSGQGLNWFFDNWIHHGGHPEFDVEWSWDESTKTVRVRVKQLQKPDDLTPLFRTPVEIELASQNQMQVRRVEVTQADQTFHFQCEQRPTRVCFDPRDWLLKTLQFEKGKEELLDQLANDPNILPRVQAASALAAHVQDRDVQSALQWSARKDSFWAVRQESVKVLAKHNSDEVRNTLLEVAATDAKSAVRREAITALGNFKHSSTNDALRKIIAEDKSDFAVAEALRALHKVDREQCAKDLVAAADRESYEQVVLRAACDTLVDLKYSTANECFGSLLDKKPKPERRAVLIAAMARLQPNDAAALERLKKEINNDRANVRRVAIDALVAIGEPSSINVLLERRGKEESPSLLRALDTAIEKLRGKERSLDQLQRELQELRDQNKKLELRLQALEKNK